MTLPRLSRASIRPRTYGVVLFGAGIGFYVYNNFSTNTQQKLRYLNSSNFTPYTLVSKNEVSSSSSIFRLRPQNKDLANADSVKEAFNTGIWSVQFKQPQLQIARNYTPLPDPDGNFGEDELQVLIRREEGGEVSNYLHDLPERSTIAIRGPFNEYDISENVTNVLFLAGGTGIAPALQIASMLKDRKDMTMQILWANRLREDCIGGQSDSCHPESGWRSWVGSARTTMHNNLPDTVCKKGQVVHLLEQLKAQSQPTQLHVDYFVDEEKRFIEPEDVSQFLGQRGSGKALILISGPDGFVEYWAGRKEWSLGHQTQGVLGGQLAKMNRKGWKVIKI